MEDKKMYNNKHNEYFDPDFILALLCVFAVIGAVVGLVIFNNNGHEVNEYTWLGYVLFAYFFSNVGIWAWYLLVHPILYTEINGIENNPIEIENISNKKEVER